MIKKKLILITGAGQGIGRYLAKNISNKFRLLLISKSNNCLKVSKDINSVNKNKADYLKINLEKRIDPRLLRKKIRFREYSNIHLIFCAGIVDPDKNSISNIEDWKKVFQINLFSHLEILNFFIHFLTKTSKQNKVIFFSGGGAANDFPEFPLYSASKTSVVRTVENFSKIYEKKNISIFAIAPGAVETNMFKKVKTIAKVKTKSTLREISNFVNFCLNTNTKLFNGKLINIKDNLKKIRNNKKENYLKLRRVE